MVATPSKAVRETVGTWTGAPHKRVSRLLDEEGAEACFLERKQAEASGKLEDLVTRQRDGLQRSGEMEAGPCSRKQADLLSTSPISSYPCRNRYGVLKEELAVKEEERQCDVLQRSYLNQIFPECL